MFILYLFANIKNVFWTWVILTLLNQILFFGACLHPYCILASIPHVSLITFGIMYVSYKIALTTYDPKTGYNYLGYDKDGFNQYGYKQDGYDRDGYNVKGFDRDSRDRMGYDQFGYDKEGFNKYGYQRDGYGRDGYNKKGIDRNGKDRLGKGFFGRMFSNKEYDEKICKMNEEAIEKNTAAQSDTKKMELKSKAEHNKEVADKGGAAKEAIRTSQAHGSTLGLSNIALDLKKKADELDAELEARRKELADKYGMTV